MITTDSNTHIVQRLVAEAINGRYLDPLGDLCSPQLAPKLRRAFSDSRSAFPDWRQEVVELVAEGAVVAAGFRCRGTHLGDWQGRSPTRRTMDIDEVYFVEFTNGSITALWGPEDTSRFQQLDGVDTGPGEMGSLS